MIWRCLLLSSTSSRDVIDSKISLLFYEVYLFTCVLCASIHTLVMLFLCVCVCASYNIIQTLPWIKGSKKIMFYVKRVFTLDWIHNSVLEMMKIYLLFTPEMTPLSPVNTRRRQIKKKGHQTTMYLQCKHTGRETSHSERLSEVQNGL